jgi:hypothetical protein
MRIREWEVWYTYGLYLEEPLVDLASIAAELVASGLAEATLQSDGMARWYASGHVQTASLGMDVDPSLRRATINFPAGIAHPFAVETLYQCAYLRYGEQVTLGEESAFAPPYVRTLLGQMELRSPRRILAMYPILKLHATGVLLIGFRMISSGALLSHRTFIDRFVQLPRETFAEWWVPPALARIIPSVGANAQPPPSPLLRDAHDAAVDYYTEVGNPHLNLQLAPVAGNESGWTLTDVTHTLAGVVRVIADRAIAVRHRELRFGHHWSARPNIHLIKFVRQQPTVAENEAAFGHAFGSILAGAVDDDADVNRRFLTPNARPFSDYAIYTNSAARLWVHATRSLRAKRELPPDPNRGAFVYEQQAVADAIDHAYALHHRLATTASDADAIERALEQQRTLVALEVALQSTGRSGDLRDLIRRNLDDLGVPALRGAAQQLLGLQQQHLALRAERRAGAWATAMTFVFGLVAVPPISRDVVEPLWKLAGWHVPDNPVIAQLLYIGIALAAVIPAIGAVRFAVDMRRKG